MATKKTTTVKKEYLQVINPQGYVNNREITNLPGVYLISPSRNCIIVNKEKVASRKGFTVLGSAKTKNKGHRSSFDWETSFNVTRSVRMNNDGELEVYFDSDWQLIKTFAERTRANFAPWWSATELQDLLLFVVQTDAVQMWSGGCAKVGSSTSNTLTIQGYKAATTIAFVEAGAGLDDYMTDSGNGFLDAGFEEGDEITVSGSASNNGTYTIKSVTANRITLSSNDDLANEAAGASVVITRPGATWSENGFLTSGVRAVLVDGDEFGYSGGEGTPTLTNVGARTSKGVATMTIASPAVVTNTGHGLVAGDMVVFSTTGALPTGVTAGTIYFVIAAGLTANAFEFSATLAGAAINTTGSQSGVHTLYKNTNVSGVSAGDVSIQAVREESPADLDGFTLDLISVTNGYVFYGDLTSRTVMISASDDYTDFSYSTPLRTPGEGFELNLDSTPTAFIPGAVEDEFFVMGRKDDAFKITFQLSADLGDESIRVKKLPTSTGQAAQSQAAVIRIKNGVAFLTFEPTIDTLTRLLSINTPQSLPISDPIKNDILSYDLTDAHGIFFQNQISVCLPSEGVVLIYDFEQQLWQPPQTLPIGRLALIDVDEDGTQVLCGHSAVSNETYRLFEGFSDNGANIRVEMHFGYGNYGTRFSQKSGDEFPTELYMSENTVVTHRVTYDYKGSTDVREFEIRGDDSTVRYTPREGGGLGHAPLGFNPLGSLATPIDDLSKMRPIDCTSLIDTFEIARSFISETLEGRFAVIAYGDNVEISENIPTFLKR